MQKVVTTAKDAYSSLGKKLRRKKKTKTSEEGGEEDIDQDFSEEEEYTDTDGDSAAEGDESKEGTDMLEKEDGVILQRQHDDVKPSMDTEEMSVQHPLDEIADSEVIFRQSEPALKLQSSYVGPTYNLQTIPDDSLMTQTNISFPDDQEDPRTDNIQSRQVQYSGSEDIQGHMKDQATLQLNTVTYDKDQEGRPENLQQADERDKRFTDGAMDELIVESSAARISCLPDLSSVERTNESTTELPEQSMKSDPSLSLSTSLQWSDGESWPDRQTQAEGEDRGQSSESSQRFLESPTGLSCSLPQTTGSAGDSGYAMSLEEQSLSVKAVYPGTATEEYEGPQVCLQEDVGPHTSDTDSIRKDSQTLTADSSDNGEHTGDKQDVVPEESPSLSEQTSDAEGRSSPSWMQKVVTTAKDAYSSLGKKLRRKKKKKTSEEGGEEDIDQDFSEEEHTDTDADSGAEEDESKESTDKLEKEEGVILQRQHDDDKPSIDTEEMSVQHPLDEIADNEVTFLQSDLALKLQSSDDSPMYHSQTVPDDSPVIQRDISFPDDQNDSRTDNVQSGEVRYSGSENIEGYMKDIPALQLNTRTYDRDQEKRVENRQQADQGKERFTDGAVGELIVESPSARISCLPDLSSVERTNESTTELPEQSMKSDPSLSLSTSLQWSDGESWPDRQTQTEGEDRGQSSESSQRFLESPDGLSCSLPQTTGSAADSGYAVSLEEQSLSVKAVYPGTATEEYEGPQVCLQEDVGPHTSDTDSIRKDSQTLTADSSDNGEHTDDKQDTVPEESPSLSEHPSDADGRSSPSWMQKVVTTAKDAYSSLGKKLRRKKKKKTSEEGGEEDIDQDFSEEEHTDTDADSGAEEDESKESTDKLEKEEGVILQRQHDDDKPSIDTEEMSVQHPLDEIADNEVTFLQSEPALKLQSSDDSPMYHSQTVPDDSPVIQRDISFPDDQNDSRTDNVQSGEVRYSGSENIEGYMKDIPALQLNTRTYDRDQEKRVENLQQADQGKERFTDGAVGELIVESSSARISCLPDLSSVERTNESTTELPEQSMKSDPSLSLSTSLQWSDGESWPDRQTQAEGEDRGQSSESSQRFLESPTGLSCSLPQTTGSAVDSGYAMSLEEQSLSVKAVYPGTATEEYEGPQVCLQEDVGPHTSDADSIRKDSQTLTADSSDNGEHTDDKQDMVPEESPSLSEHPSDAEGRSSPSWMQKVVTTAKDAYSSLGKKLRRKKKKKTSEEGGEEDIDQDFSDEEEYTDTDGDSAAEGDESKEGTDMLEKEDGVILQRQHDDDKSSADTAEMSGQRPLDESEDSEVTFIQSEPALKLQASYFSPTYHSQTVPDDSPLTQRDISFLDDENDSRTDNVMSREPRTSGTENSPGYMNDQPSLHLNTVTYDKDQEGRPENLQQADQGEKRFTDGAVDELIVESSAARISCLPDLSSVERTNESTTELPEQSMKSDPSLSLSTSLQWSDGESWPDRQTQAEGEDRGQSSESSQRFLESPDGLSCSLPQTTGSAADSGYAVSLEEQSLSVKAVYPGTATEEYEGPQVCLQEDVGPHTSDTDSIRKDSQTLTADSSDNGEHTDDKQDMVPEESPSLSEHTSDADGRSSPSWMQKVVTTAKDAYSSLGKKLRRKKKMKTSEEGGEEDIDQDFSEEEEYTDTDADSGAEEDELKESTDMLEKEEGVILQRQHDDDKPSADTAEMSVHGLLDQIEDREVTFLQSEALHELQTSYTSPTYHSQTVPDDSLMTSKDVYFPDDENVPRNDNVQSTEPRTSGSENSQGYMNDQPSLQLNIVTYDKDQEGRPENLQQADQDQKRFTDGAVDELIVESSAARISCLPDLSSVERTNESTTELPEQSVKSDPSLSLSTSLQWSDGESWPDRQTQAEGEDRGQSSESSQRFLESPTGLSCSLPQTTGSAADSGYAVSLEEQSLSVKAVYPGTATEEYEGPQVCLQEDVGPHTSDTDSIRKDSQTLTADSSDNGEHTDDKQDTVPEESPSLSEHPSDADGRSSPSWMQKVVTTAKDAYSSLGKKLRRKKKMKTSEEGGEEDIDQDFSEEEEYTDTDAESGAEEDESKESTDMLEKEEGVILQRQHDDDKPSADTAEMSVQGLLDQIEDREVTFLQSEAVHELQTSYASPTYHSQTVPDDSLMTSKDVYFPDDENVPRNDNVQSTVPRTSGTENSQGYMNDQPSLQLNIVTYDKDQEGRPENLQQADEGEKRFTDGAVDELIVESSAARISCLPDLSSVERTNESTTELPEQSMKSDPSLSLSTSLQWSDGESWPDRQTQAEDRGQSSESSQRFLESPDGLSCSLRQKTGSAADSGYAVSLEEQSLSVKAVYPGTATEEYEGPQVCLQEDVGPHTSDTDSIRKDSQTLTADSSDNGEHTDDKQDMVPEESPSLSEHPSDADGRSSPSWMQKVVTTAKDAYSSLGKKLRRKKKTKTSEEGGEEDIDQDFSEEEEYTDTDADSAAEGDESKEGTDMEMKDSERGTGPISAVADLDTADFAERDYDAAIVAAVLDADRRLSKSLSEDPSVQLSDVDSDDHSTDDVKGLSVFDQEASEHASTDTAERRLRCDHASQKLTESAGISLSSPVLLPPETSGDLQEQAVWTRIEEDLHAKVTKYSPAEEAIVQMEHTAGPQIQRDTKAEFCRDSEAITGAWAASDGGTAVMGAVLDANSRTQSLPDADSRTQSLPDADSRTQSVLDADSRTQSVLDADSRTQSVLDADSRTQSVLDADSRTQSVLDADSRTQSMLDADSRTQSVLDADSRTQSMLDADSPTQSMLDADSRTQSVLDADSRTQSILDADSRTQFVLDADSRTQSMLDAYSRTQSVLDADSRTQSVLDADSRTQSVLDADSRTQSGHKVNVTESHQRLLTSEGAEQDEEGRSSWLGKDIVSSERLQGVLTAPSHITQTVGTFGDTSWPSDGLSLASTYALSFPTERRSCQSAEDSQLTVTGNQEVVLQVRAAGTEYREATEGRTYVGQHVTMPKPPRQLLADGTCDVLEADDKPLIGNEAAEDENEATEADQENIDPSNMPLSSLFKTTKGKKSKSKKNKGKNVAETNVGDDVSNKNEVQAEEQTNASELQMDVKPGEEEGGGAVLYSKQSGATALAEGEGPNLTPAQGEGGEEGEEGAEVVDTQPPPAPGTLPPDTSGREKQSLLHDHNPEGMVCCTIL
ncbi:uncharacterized protein LOC143299352 isoform X2 [Babylonia areolata]|uniref:uncharacterized protein LOC143299352 isoform X2 n=1 Tax=Babylonia areolata TaxID=304850 RepID=UPI003FD2227D